MNPTAGTNFVGTTGYNTGDGSVTISGDKAKAVVSTGNCGSAAAAGGTSIVTNLGSGGSTSSTAAFTWTSLGQYKLCYQLKGGSYTEITPLITVYGSAPTSFSTSGTVEPGAAATITFNSGSCLTLGPNEDQAKAVASDGTCSDAAAAAAGGSAVVTDLGPDDASGTATSATAIFTFTTAAQYKLCYSVAGTSSWSQVGSALLTVAGVSGWSTSGDAGTGAATPVTFAGAGLHRGMLLRVARWQHKGHILAQCLMVVSVCELWLVAY